MRNNFEEIHWVCPKCGGHLSAPKGIVPHGNAKCYTCGGTYVEELTYDEFVKLANIKESDVNYYVFSNWNLKLGTKFKIILVTYA